MAAKMVLARVRSRWSSPLLVAVSVPILGVPFLSSVKAGSVKVHPRELEIYDPVEPSQDTLKPNEEEVTGFEQKVSTVRKFVWGWTTSVQEGIAKAREHFSVAEQKSLEFIELIQTDQEFQMKVGAISAAVLGGAVLAGRGLGKREDPAVVSESSLAVGNKEEIGLVATDEKKDQILLLEQTAAKANVEGDLGQSNPEDKDMYSTRAIPE
ncbi:hypothetical protein P5673_019922 [Acropora cervicornis]|uniref:Uncharacterized protein n=1 Tax=Acropora cervicornis TaxID=6130 RepID=A0AAD9QB24_ACRCE|nr:hypothetical protein P5673_019922 [Acropora cervicornis]